MTLLLERDRASIRSRVGDAERAAAALEARYDEAVAEADAAFDRWERTSVDSPHYENRKREGKLRGSHQNQACRAHIAAVTKLTSLQRKAATVDDPSELERRLGIAREHDEWWRTGA